MIRIEVLPDKISVRGHAGFDVKGKDIVCAGVSALVFSFIKSVDELADIEMKVISSEGNITMIFPSDEKDISEKEKYKLELLKKSLLIGLNEIAKKYPENVLIEGRQYGS